MDLQFSVGQVKLKQSSVTKKTIVPLTSVSLNHEVATSTAIREDGIITDIFKEEEKTTITMSYAAESFDTTLIAGADYDIYFEAGTPGHGIVATLASCKLTSYDLKQTQDGFAIATVVFLKKGPLTDAPGTSITKQRVKFDSTYLGDSAFVTPIYSGNVQTYILPTALGVLVRSTSDMGGGELKLTVSCMVEKTTRLELEQYLITLYGALSTGSKTLTVEYGATSYTITDCKWVGGSAAGGSKKHSEFSLEFIKSAYS